MVPYLKAGQTYDSAFITADATEEDAKTLESVVEESSSSTNPEPEPSSSGSSSSSSGCDAGLGALALMAALPLMSRKVRK